MARSGCTTSKDSQSPPGTSQDGKGSPPSVIPSKSIGGRKEGQSPHGTFEPSELTPIIEKQQPTRHPSRSVSQRRLAPIVLTHKVVKSPGKVNQYTKVKRIGEGGFSKVYLYTDGDGREVAVKKACRSLLKKRKSYSNDPQTKQLRVTTAYDTILHEIKVLQYIHNSDAKELAHVCRVHEIIDDETCDDLYIIMEAGHSTLAEWNADLYTFACPDSPTGHLLEEHARGIFVQLLTALSGLRLIGVIHHDIKPQNIILTRHGAKLIDFGSAIVIPWESPAPVDQSGDNTTTVSVSPDSSSPSLIPIPSRNYDASFLTRDVGTLFFASPEVFLGRYSGFDSDLWALGVSMFGAVTGKLPFLDLRANPTATLAATIELIKVGQFDWPTKIPVSSEFKHLINWILHVDPSERPTLDMCHDHPWFHMLTITATKSIHVDDDEFQ